VNETTLCSDTVDTISAAYVGQCNSHDIPMPRPKENCEAETGCYEAETEDVA